VPGSALTTQLSLRFEPEGARGRGVTRRGRTSGQPGAGSKGARVTVRFSRTVPASADDLKSILLPDVDALASGLRLLAAGVPLPGLGTLDALAADGQGRPALIVVDLHADGPLIATALAQWEWAIRNLSFLLHLAPQLGLNRAQEPRLMVAAERLSDDALRLAACVPRPEIELYEITPVAAGDQRGILSRRVAPSALPSQSMAADMLSRPALSAEARSLTRRMAEELRDQSREGRPFTLTPISGGIDVSVDGRRLGAIVVTPSGVEARLEGAREPMPVTDDDACRRAVGLLTRSPRPEPAEPEGPARPAAGGPVAALTPEEIAEFEGLAAGAGHAPSVRWAPADEPVAEGTRRREPAIAPAPRASAWYVEN